MSFIDRKGSVNVGEFRRGSKQSSFTDADNTLPPSVLKTKNRDSISFSGGRRQPNLKNLTGSTVSETEYLIHVGHKTEHTWRHYLVGPIILMYIAAYVTCFSAFSLYVYARVQHNKFPNETFNSSSQCDVDQNSTNYMHQKSVQEEAATWTSYFGLAQGVPAIISNIVLGAITDKFGRKFLFVVPCIGTIIKCTTFLVGQYFEIKLEYYLISTFIEGLTGTLFTMILVSFTYISDITPQKGRKRSFAIVMIELSIGIGSAVFALTSGYFIQNTGFFYPMVSTLPMLAISLILIIFLPESFPKEKRSTETYGLMGNLKTAYDLFFGSFNMGRRWMYNVLMVTFALTAFGAFGRITTDSLYQLDEPFCWSPEKLGNFGALRNSLQQMGAMVFVKCLQMIMSDEGIAILASFSFGAGFILEGFASTDFMLYAVPFVSCLGMLTIPMCRALMSKLTRADQQGAVFASISAVEAAINLLSAVLSSVIYSHTVTYYRGFVYFVFAATNFICIILMSVYRFGSRRTLPIVDVRR